MKTRLMIIIAVLIGSFCGIQTGNACSPPPVAILTAEPNDTVIGVNVIFDGNSSYTLDDETIVKYEWDWTNDGVYDYNEVPPCDGIATHAYSSGGTYTAKLRVTDNRGLTGVDTAIVYVNEPRLWYVDADANGSNDGSSWVNAFTDLQDALAATGYGDEIWVTAGTYRPTDSNDRTKSFALVEGVELYGGFDGTETSRSERDWKNHRSF